MECKSLMAVKKDRKISLVVMVITRKYYIYYSWPPATRNKCNIFLVMTITTCDILRSFFTAIKDSPSTHALGALPRWTPLDICQCLNSKWLTFPSIMANASENKGTFCKYVRTR